MKKIFISMLMALVLSATGLTGFSVSAQETATIQFYHENIPTAQDVSGDSIGQRDLMTIFDNVSIDRNGRTWDHPDNLPYTRVIIKNTTGERMTVRVTKNGNLIETTTIHVGGTVTGYGTNWGGYMSIDFKTPSGTVSGTLKLDASNLEF